MSSLAFTFRSTGAATHSRCAQGPVSTRGLVEEIANSQGGHGRYGKGLRSAGSVDGDQAPSPPQAAGRYIEVACGGVEADQEDEIVERSQEIDGACRDVDGQMSTGQCVGTPVARHGTTIKWSSPSAKRRRAGHDRMSGRRQSTAMVQESAHSEARHCTPLGTRPTRLKLSTAVLRQRRVVLRVESSHERRLRGVINVGRTARPVCIPLLSNTFASPTQMRT